MNKETAGDDLGLTLQTGFVTKALVGLFGTDKFRLAVSQDGSAFFDGLIVDNATGIVDQPRLPRFKGYTNYDNYVAVDTWTKLGINNTEYNDQAAFDAANNRFVAPIDGTYLFGATLLYKINARLAPPRRPLPTPKEVLEYVHHAPPDAVARWELDRASRDIAEARAQAAIERALQAAHASSGREQQRTRPTAQ